LKARGDLHFYRKEYAQCLEVYNSLLVNKAVKGATLRRDVIETKARALLAMGDYTQAKQIADQILNTTHDHDDFRIVALALKIDILQEQANHLEKAGEDSTACKRELMARLMRVLDMHAGLSRYWILLAKLYTPTPNPRYAMRCLYRARTKSHGSHVLDLGVEKFIDKLKKQFPEIDFGDNLASSIGDASANTETEETPQEFNDLGRSVRMKEIEETLAKSSQLVTTTTQEDNQEQLITTFENKWFKTFKHKEIEEE
jgi:tetratricopeptide (TPR) repeat protein